MSQDDLKYLMRDHFLKYASYVILDRAIPHVIDGLKPVQRRLLYVLWLMDDGKLHKVANIAGQTMAFHPHGEAAIVDALVNVSNKNYLIDQQGNFGNLLTGDAAAAARYIEARLSPLAREAMFNADITEMALTYDGRNEEPVVLPAKIPLLLLHGAEGIAVGMSTSIFPHNFCELIEAEIACLEGKSYELLPDFLTGGIMDASEYAQGKGKVKLRAKIDIVDAKTLMVREVCYGTTTESLIRSIDEAAKKGKIKIEGIHDYTSSAVEIAITLPRGQYAEEVINALYAYTECQVTLHSQMIVIKDELPWEPTIPEIIELHVARLQGYLQRELEIARDGYIAKIFEKTLERIFIENRLYKQIEEVGTMEEIHETISRSLRKYQEQLSREPNQEDRERLLAIPIRRITRYDLDKNRQEIEELEGHLEKVQKELKQIKRYTIRYLQDLLKRYGKGYPRRTQMTQIEQLDKRAIATKSIKVGVDFESGFLGTKITSDQVIECTNFDKLLLLFSDGTYQVIPVAEKLYVQREGKLLMHAMVADKETPVTVVYKDERSHICYGKKFVVKKYIMEKMYRFLEEGSELQFLTLDGNAKVELQLLPRAGQRVSKEKVELGKVSIKGTTAKGIQLSRKPVKKVIAL